MYSEQELVRVARRENNKKRSYLIVNPLQGKHLPVRPKDALAVFHELAETLRGAYEGERLLLIGFAETATAIGAAVAAQLSADYIQTTRETVPGAEYLCFSEEHSHATEQKLVRSELDRIAAGIDRIVFIEDEITTGRTILNIAGLLEQRYPGIRSYSAASLLNGMREEELARYEARGIALHYLVKTDHRGYAARAEQFRGDGTYVCARGEEVPGAAAGRELEKSCREITAGGRQDARRLVHMPSYREACEGLARAAEESAEHLDSMERVLVLGTEEFMYPALCVARRLEERGLQVRFHATTRSPIGVSSEEEYPLHCRYELASLYDRERTTYVYELGRFDGVFVVTDARPETSGPGMESLCRALALAGNREIFAVRWCE